MSWKHLGTRGLGRLVEANVAIAKYLSARIAASNDFEQLPETTPELSVVCFRHVPPSVRPAPDVLDAHQDALAGLARGVRRRRGCRRRDCAARRGFAPAS